MLVIRKNNSSSLKPTFLTFAFSLLCMIFILISICARVQAQEKNLAAHWSFDEVEGNFVKDLSGNGNDATINGKYEQVEGISNKAIECTGSTVINCGKGESLRIPQDITTEFWIQPTEDIGPNDSRINVLYMLWGPMFAFCTGWGPDGALTYWYDGPNPKPTIHSKTTKWEKDTWYYIVGTYDGSISKLYVNAEVEASIDAEGDIKKREEPLKIGQDYIGIIDEVKIHSRAFSEQEIKNNYNRILKDGEAVDANGKLPLMWGQLKAD